MAQEGEGQESRKQEGVSEKRRARCLVREERRTSSHWSGCHQIATALQLVGRRLVCPPHICSFIFQHPPTPPRGGLTPRPPFMGSKGEPRQTTWVGSDSKREEVVLGPVSYKELRSPQVTSGYRGRESRNVGTSMRTCPGMRTEGPQLPAKTRTCHAEHSP